MKVKRNLTCFPIEFSKCDWLKTMMTGKKTRGSLAQGSKGIVNA